MIDPVVVNAHRTILIMLSSRARDLRRSLETAGLEMTGSELSVARHNTWQASHNIELALDSLSEALAALRSIGNG